MLPEKEGFLDNLGSVALRVGVSNMTLSGGEELSGDEQGSRSGGPITSPSRIAGSDLLLLVGIGSVFGSSSMMASKNTLARTTSNPARLRSARNQLGMANRTDARSQQDKELLRAGG